MSIETFSEWALKQHGVAVDPGTELARPDGSIWLDAITVFKMVDQYMNEVIIPVVERSRPLLDAFGE